MGLWLDHKLFGNGRGLKSPYFNDTYFWLRDEMRPQSKGRLYTWMGGFGAQLHSIEWFAPHPDTCRRLFGQEFKVFNVSRCWLKVRVAWAATRQFKDYEEVRALERQLVEAA